MYNIPDMYTKESVINKEHFISRADSSQNKKKIRESLEKVRLKYQIDQGLANLVDEDYNIQVIMILEVNLKSMKHIDYINKIFQTSLKGYAIIKYRTENKVALGYGYKRLNKQDLGEVVLEDSFVTEEYEEIFLLDSYLLYEKYLNFSSLKNRNNKLELYIESMVKAYIISNRQSFKNYKVLLESDIYYNLESTLVFYNLLKKIINTNLGLKNKKITAEKIDLNKKLVILNKEVEGLLNGRH